MDYARQFAAAALGLSLCLSGSALLYAPALGKPPVKPTQRVVPQIALINKAFAQINAGQNAQATATLQAALKWNQQGNNGMNTAMIRKALGDVEARQQHFVSAAGQYRMALAAIASPSPFSVQTGFIVGLLTNYGNVEGRLEHFEQAQKQYELALALAGKSPHPDITSINLIKKNQAASKHNHVLKAFMGEGSSYQQGRMLIHNHHYLQAEPLLLKALGETADVPSLKAVVQYELGLNCSNLMRYDEAQTYLEAALGMDGGQSALDQKQIPAAQELLGQVYFRQGKLEASRQILQQSIQKAGLDNLKAESSQRLAEINALPQADNYLRFLRPGITRWSDRTQSISVMIISAPDVDNWKPEDSDILKSAFAQWQHALAGRLTFTYTQNPHDADVLVRWENKLASAEVEGDDPNQKLLGFNKTEIWNNYMAVSNISFATHDIYGNPISDIEIRRIYLHEIGHMLGIKGHSPDPRDIMYPSTTGANQLSAHDIATINLLYHSPATITNPVGIHLQPFQQFTGAAQAAAVFHNAGNYVQAYPLALKAYQFFPYDAQIDAMYAADAYHTGHIDEAVAAYIEAVKLPSSQRSDALRALSDVMANVFNQSGTRQKPVYQAALADLNQAVNDMALNLSDRLEIQHNLELITHFRPTVINRPQE